MERRGHKPKNMGSLESREGKETDSPPELLERSIATLF